MSQSQESVSPENKCPDCGDYTPRDDRCEDCELGARGNWYGETAPDNDRGEKRRDSDRPTPTDSNKYLNMAHLLLKEWSASNADGRMACPYAMSDPDDMDIHDEEQTVILSDPCLYVPIDATHGTDFGVERHRRRYNPEHGYITFGGPLLELPTRDFLDLVEHVVDDLVAEFVRDDEKQLIESYVRRQKGTTSDEVILANICEHLDRSSPVRLSDLE